jgi:hypothetical protein
MGIKTDNRCKRYRAKKRAAGLCIACGQTKAEKSLCGVCVVKNLATVQAFYARHGGQKAYKSYRAALLASKRSKKQVRK